MKPVLVQNLIQAAKKKRARQHPIRTHELPSRPKNTPPQRDRSSLILFGALVLFVVIVALVGSI